MIPRNDPRVRMHLDQIAQNVKSVKERTQESLYSCTQSYIHPFITTISHCTHSCIAPCSAEGEDQWRRRYGRSRSRGRAEFSFDFYDDWEDNETDALLGLGDDDNDTSQPPRERQMNYGTRQTALMRPKSLQDNGARNMPSSSYFGFMDRTPFKFVTKGVKYQPSIADLQEHPASRHMIMGEAETLLSASGNDDAGSAITTQKKIARSRSNTQGSTHTTNSYSSRGDIFSGEDEMDDAVPLGDEFALTLERKIITHTMNDGLNESRNASRAGSASYSSLATINTDKQMSIIAGDTTLLESRHTNAASRISDPSQQVPSPHDIGALQSMTVIHPSSASQSAASETMAEVSYLEVEPFTAGERATNSSATIFTRSSAHAAHLREPSAVEITTYATAEFNAAALPSFTR